MNWVDVSDKTINAEWRQLLVKFDIDPTTMTEAVGLDSPLIDPLQTEKIYQERLEAGRKETFDMVQVMIQKPLRALLDWQCPEWKVSDEEVKDLADIYAEVFAKHFPMFCEHPVVQKIYEFVEDMGLEIKATIRTYRFVKKYKDKPRLPAPKEEKTDKPKEGSPASPPNDFYTKQAHEV